MDGQWGRGEPHHAGLEKPEISLHFFKTNFYAGLVKPKISLEDKIYF